MVPWARQSSVLLLALSVGCGSISPRWGVTIAPRPPFAKQAKSLPEPAENASRDADQGEESADDEPLVADNQSASKGEGIRHDPATRMLIEAELRDAGPDERKEWLAYLNSVEADRVPYILRARRMAKGRDGDNREKEVGDSDDILTASLKSEAGGADAEPSEAEVTALAEQEVDSPAEPNPGIEAPEPAVATGWQKKFKSLADPNWIWSPASEETPAEKEPAKASVVETTPKSERGPFGLPLILGNSKQEESEPTKVAAATSAKATVPKQTAELPREQSRITPGSELWEDELHRLISLLEAEVASPADDDAASISRENVRQQVALRMLHLAVNEPEKAQQVIPGLPPGEQEFWTSLFLGLATYLDDQAVKDPGERATQLVGQLRTAAHQMQQSARLQLRNISFCKKINSYGNYETFETNEFSPGQSVLVYAEIRNFKSEPTVDGYYRTLVNSTVEIYSGGVEARLIDRSTFDATEDLCRTLRSDYYHSYQLDLPAHLTAGPHVLKLTIQDELSGKLASETISFTVK